MSPWSSIHQITCCGKELLGCGPISVKKLFRPSKACWVQTKFLLTMTLAYLWVSQLMSLLTVLGHWLLQNRSTHKWRSFGTHFWGEMFSPVPVWMPVHLDNGPHTPDHHPWSLSWHSHFGCSLPTAMGYHFICLQLPDPVPQHEGTHQCRWLIAFAYQLSLRSRSIQGCFLLQFGPNPSFSCHCSERRQLFKAQPSGELSNAFYSLWLAYQCSLRLETVLLMAGGVYSRERLLAMGSSFGSSCKVEIPNSERFA